MSQSKTGNRDVVSINTDAVNRNTVQRGTADRRPKARRIVIIRDGESVGRKPGR